MDVDGIVLPPPDDHLSRMIWRGKEEKNDGSTDAIMSVEARLQASGPILQQKHWQDIPVVQRSHSSRIHWSHWD